jgi:hypothetical protein
LSPIWRRLIGAEISDLTGPGGSVRGSETGRISSDISQGKMDE